MPTLADIIPSMDAIDNRFTHYLRDEGLDVAIRAALRLAKKTESLLFFDGFISNVLHHNEYVILLIPLSSKLI